MRKITINIIKNSIKCPKCYTINADENGVKEICDHLVFISTSHSDEPDLDKENLIKDYDPDRFDDVIDFLKLKLNDNYLMFVDSSTRQIDAYFIYKDI